MPHREFWRVLREIGLVKWQKRALSESKITSLPSSTQPALLGGVWYRLACSLSFIYCLCVRVSFVFTLRVDIQMSEASFVAE